MTETTINNSKPMAEISDEQLTQFIIDAIQDKKGRAIAVVDLSEIESAPCREFVLCEGRTPQQVSAIADNIRESLLENHRIKPYNYDGYRNARWIVVDYGSVMVHVFVPEDRLHYNLEELWADAVITEVPDLD